LAKVVKPKNRRMKLLKVLIGVVCVAVLGIGYVAVSIDTYGKQTVSSPAQAAIVLGASVWEEEPSPVFRERINHAIELYRAGNVQKLLFTGGLGKGSKMAEAEAAKRYAMRQGVPASAILLESESHTTLENLRFAQQVARRDQLHSFLIVSDPLHMKRAMAMASDLGLHASPSPTPTTRVQSIQNRWGMLMRETYFYLDYRLRPKL
jgi:uncharacterized SAM-binding protein YcdF (DUF218 family)